MNKESVNAVVKQLTARGMVIGAIGAVIITMSSMFVALKLSSLPWPIMFVALISMFALKGLGNTNLNEINVTHTAMSAGAMVSGGLAFTIPGIWILRPDAEPNFLMILIVSIGGTILGLIFTALIRKYFVETQDLAFPMGQAAAETLIVGDEGGSKAKLLFSSLAVAGLFALLRDWFHKIPAVLLNQKMMSYGSLGGIWLSPMLIAVGYIIGPLAISIWFLGAIIGDFGIMIGTQSMGIFDYTEAVAFKQSLGIGLMVGTGFGILLKGILPNAKEIFGSMFSKNSGDSIIRMRWAPIVMVLLAFIFTTVLNLGVIASVITIIGVWLATSMSSQCVGQSGINPMEIFGILVLIAVKAVTNIGDIEAFYVAAIVAVACGLVGDVMNDFKEGHILNSNPKAQWIAECIGGMIGAVVSVATLYIIFKAYGGGAIGSEEFPAAQAAAVASMVGGISNMTAFLIGMIAAVILYFLNFPVMTLGLGVYLPFYLSATAFIGGMIRLVVDRFGKSPRIKDNGNIIAAGCLGGEAVVGVLIAIYIAVTAI
ncbi:MAG: OPT/YSL family transporter [Peptostreptococcaceae bacterium]|nr:OPT/YSL family transporter [Peptostreptococcaceae bacterium]